MNHYIGKQAADEGRPSLYPEIDFCLNPEAICASEQSNELRWSTGMFAWIKKVQSYTSGGWNYIDKVQKLGSDVFQSGSLDATVIMGIDCLLKTGSHICDSAEDMTERLNEVLAVISVFNLPTASPTTTMAPSTSPTYFPTGESSLILYINVEQIHILTSFLFCIWNMSVKPTDQPTENPTATASPTSSPNIFSYPSRDDVSIMLRIISDKQASITSKLLTPRTAVDDKNIYSFEGFLQSLRVLAAGTVQGIYFYIGHNVSRERNYRKRGMVNVAAFLSYTRTVAVYNTICDERNVDGINNKVGDLCVCSM